MDRLVVRSNIDTRAANALRRENASEITPASLLNPIVTALTDMAFAARQGAELETSPVVAELVKAKAQELFVAREQSEIARRGFQELVFRDAHAIREAVNSGERSLREAIDLAKNARRFRSWLANQEPDADLLHEYYQATVAGS